MFPELNLRRNIYSCEIAIFPMLIQNKINLYRKIIEKEIILLNRMYGLCMLNMKLLKLSTFSFHFIIMKHDLEHNTTSKPPSLRYHININQIQFSRIHSTVSQSITSVSCILSGNDHCMKVICALYIFDIHNVNKTKQ